jgi:Family of unknown function (DUF6498)/Protein of unknown function (DUF3592)
VATLAQIHRFPTALPVILANCVPIVGVLAFGWDLLSIMFVYWLETAVVVFYSVLKVVTVGGPFTLLWMPFHLATFGMFMSFHLMMILGLAPGHHAGFFPPELLRGLLGRTWGAGVGLLVSHGISFVVNFLGNGEYRRTTVDEQKAAPWKRLIIMHVTTIAGAWSVGLFDAPVGALVMLAVLKIVVDLHGHLRERPTPSGAGAPQRPVPAPTPETQLTGILGLFGAFLVLCSLILVAGSGGEVYRASRVRSQWPTASAEVVDCRVRDGAADKSRQVSHLVRCRFRYDVGGIEHVATYSTHSTYDAETVAAMHRWVAGHPRGAPQVIHYDRVEPDRVSLGGEGEAIDPPQVGETLTAAAGFAAAGALLLLAARWQSRRSLGRQPA